MTTFVGEVAEPEAPIIESIEDLMGILSPITGDGGERWYRGHRDQSWQLTASVYRSQRHRDAEQSMLARFRQEAAAVGLQHGFDGWGWLAFAQHHELPTRLLDWSQSPLIALYFACEAGEQPTGAGQEATGEFFVLNPVALNREAGDPDGHLRLLSDADQALASYIPGGDGFRQNPRAVVSPLVFDRIRFQAGTFTVEQAPRSTSDEPLRESTAVQSFAIPGESKGHIRDQLDALGFNEANIYRDLDRIAQRIKKQGGR